MFVPDWTPTGPTVICVEFLLSLADPPIKLVRKVIKPINMGGVGLDLSVFILLMGIQFIMAFLENALRYYQ